MLQHIVARVPSFPIAAATFPAVAAEVRRRFPGAVSDARARGDRLVEGRFDLLGYEDLLFGKDGGREASQIDWHLDPVHGRRAPLAWWSRVPYLEPSCGDHKIIWELNRHQHWLALGRAAWLTGDGSYRDEFVRQLQGWLHDNPPQQGINWASMLEVSLRCIAWVWALHAFAPLEADTSRDAGQEPPWALDVLLGIREQMDHVERNLSTYFSPNTHLIGEALGLYVCGRALPELDAAPRWAEAGRRVLLEQIDRQILPDGGHCERSAHYHRYALDFYLLALAVARTTGDACARPLAAASSRLAEAALVLADQRGWLPALGDDDGGMLFPICRRAPADIRDSLATAAALLDRPDLAIGPAPEEPLWLIGQTAAQDGRAGGDGRPSGRARSTALPDTGYFVSRKAPGSHAVIDAGPHGYLNGGHAHADALSLTLVIDGRPVVIDPGTGSYTASPSWRDRLRSTPFHNTVTLGGRSQSIASGPFHWQTTANGAVDRWCPGAGVDYFEGVHDGYHPHVHRRRVVALGDGVIVVVDSITGAAKEQADLHWHLDPAWRVDVTPRPGGGLVRLAQAGAQHWLALEGGEIDCFRGDEGTGLGWCSPVYGRLVPCTSVRVRAGGAGPGLGLDDNRSPGRALPSVFVSVFATSSDAGAPVVSLIPGEIDARLPPGDDDSIGVGLEREGAEDLMLFARRPPQTSAADDPGEAGPRRAVAAFDIGDERIETDARFLRISRDRTGESTRLVLLDGGYVRSSDHPEPLLSQRPERGWTVREIGPGPFSRDG